MMSDVDRKFSNGTDWENSIDWDDASDGSEGGYDRHGSFIIVNAMMEIIQLRVRVDCLASALDRKDAVLLTAREALRIFGGYGRMYVDGKNALIPDSTITAAASFRMGDYRKAFKALSAIDAELSYAGKGNSDGEG